MGWLMNWLEGINWEQLLHKVTASIDTVLVNAVGAVSATVNIAITASFALIISVYMSLSTESLGHQARTLVCAYLKPAHAAGVLKFCRLFRQSFAKTTDRLPGEKMHMRLFTTQLSWKKLPRWLPAAS